LIVGGGRGTTLEVLIYEKIRLSNEWSGAVFLSLAQSIFIFLISLLLRNNYRKIEVKNSNLKLVTSPLALVFISVFIMLYFIGYLDGLLAGIKMISTFYEFQSGIFWSFLGSLAIGLTVGGVSFLGLMAIAFSWPKLWFAQFLRGYLGPSTSLACFAFLILGPNGGVFSFLKIPVVITLLSLCNLVRLGWLNEMNTLDSQIEVATTMGASPRQIFREITFPQIAERAGILSGIASVWACGDFAVSRILANKDVSLGMMTETLMSSYRLNQACVMSLLIIIVGLMCYLFCIGGSRVLRRKFKY
jgi:thiamine transport system permease protein